MGVKKEEKKTLKTDKTEKISKFALKLSELRKERGISQKKSCNRPWNFTGTFKPL